MLGCMCIFELQFSLGISPVVGSLGHMLALFLVFLSTSTQLFIVTVSTIYAFIHFTNIYHYSKDGPLILQSGTCIFKLNILFGNNNKLLEL